MIKIIFDLALDLLKIIREPAVSADDLRERVTARLATAVDGLNGIDAVHAADWAELHAAVPADTPDEH